MLFALIAIVLVQSLTVVEANLLSRERPGDDLELLCRGKRVDLSTFGQLKQLAARVEGSKCSNETKAAIQGLAKIYEEYNGDVCSMSHIKEFQEYNKRYTQTQFFREKMPHPLRKFAIAYGLQVSNLCKRNMMEALTGEQGQRKLEAMGKEAGELFNRLTSANGPVRRVLGNLCTRDEPLMPGDLNDFMEQYESSEDLIQLSDELLPETGRTFVLEVKRQCEQNYRPAYGPFMLPLVRLANLGLSYRDQELISKLESPATAEEIGRWSQIVFTCETLESINFEDLYHSSRKIRNPNDWPSYESPVKVTLDEQTRVVDKTNKRLSKAIRSAKIDSTKLVSRKVSRMSAEVKLRSSDARSLDNFVKRLPRTGVLGRGALVGSAQRLLESLRDYALTQNK